MAKKEELGFNINKFIESSDEAKDHYIERDASPAKSESKSKRTKVSKTSPSVPATTQQAQPPVPATSMSFIQESIPYTSLYADTNKQLDESINALKILGNGVVGELQTVMQSKTLRNKYNIINDLSMTATTIVNAQIAAIKEKNNTATQASRFELDRMKSMKSVANEEDDNQRIASMYDAFINTPIGVGGGPAMLAPSMQDMMLTSTNPAGPGFARQTMGADNTQAWEQSLNPAESRMVLEAKGVIETVVVYDAATGSRWYDVLDKATGQSMPGVEKPSADTVHDLDINVRGGYAKDSNRGVSYRLIVMNPTGSLDPSMSDY